MSVKKGNILVVDDNAGIRKALEMLLPLHFGEVKTIPSPVQLISTIGTFRPDVILLDMNFNTDINTGNEGLICNLAGNPLSPHQSRRSLEERIVLKKYLHHTGIVYTPLVCAHFFLPREKNFPA